MKGKTTCRVEPCGGQPVNKPKSGENKGKLPAREGLGTNRGKGEWGTSGKIKGGQTDLCFREQSHPSQFQFSTRGNKKQEVGILGKRLYRKIGSEWKRGEGALLKKGVKEEGRVAESRKKRCH